MSNSEAPKKPGIVERGGGRLVRFLGGGFGWLIGGVVAVVLADIYGNIAQVTSYYSAAAYYEQIPQGDFDAGPHLRALAFSIHQGTRTGAAVGVIVFYLAFIAARKRFGFWSIAIGFVVGLVGAPIAGYIAGLSPE